MSEKYWKGQKSVIQKLVRWMNVFFSPDVSKNGKHNI